MKFLNASIYTTNVPLAEAYFRKNPPRYRSMNVFFQHEHNLVLPGGRSLNKADQIGEVTSIFDPAEKYHVRVVNKDYYYCSDIVMEYNMPNIENIKRARAFSAEIAEGIVYCPSIPFPYSNLSERGLSVISNFVNEAEPRRAWVIEGLRRACPGYQNIQGIYDLEGLRNLYSSARIIVNTHQTWHHHSIEEFRVLPALACGCVVISEKVPLMDVIPYSEYIVWCDYGAIPEVTAHVLANYASYFESIHGPSSGLNMLLQTMQEEFESSMDNLLNNRKHFSAASRLRRRLAGWARGASL